MELISSNIKVDFLGKKYFAFFLSALLISGAVYLWIDKGGAKYGIDYLGGHELVVKVGQGVTSKDIREALAKKQLEAVVQSFEEGASEYSIRMPSAEGTKEVKDAITSALKEVSPETLMVIKADFVGPTIGEELKRNAFIAIIIGLFGMLLYISFRFEVAFAIGAVAALFHDVIVTMGVYLYFDRTISVATLAAALTIVGYSVNDTIIVFDRIREEIYRDKKATLEEIINFSISATLSRTVITSLLTLFSAFTLLVYGGGGIAELSLFLFVGVITGTYSTLFIASPVALAWENFRSKS